jgi:hypothetical protein
MDDPREGLHPALDWILNGRRLNEYHHFGPDWFWILKAKMTPGTCSRCYHRYYLHFINCEKAR